MTLLYTRDGNPAFLGNTFHNQDCFYIGAGPSLLSQPLGLLSSRGILTFAVNNVAAKTVKPNLWCCGDEPKSFHDVIWNDPTILKFCPANKSQKHYYIDGKNSDQAARFTPNTFIYNLPTKSRFDENKFLSEDVCTWGNDTNIVDTVGQKGGRSIMLVAFKLMYFLGFKRIYLLGCDFNMQHDKKKSGYGLTYAFPQYKHQGGVASNNKCYEILNKRFKVLYPKLKEKGVQVFNCTPNSGLTAFPVMDFEEAIKIASKPFDKKVSTKEMYG